MPAMDVLSMLAEVRRVRAENPGRRVWFDAQERCLVGLVRRFSGDEGGDAVASSDALLRDAVCRCLEETVAEPAVRQALARRIALARWRASGGLPKAIQISLWEGEVRVAATGGAGPASGGLPGRPEAAAPPEGGRARAPSLMAALGETSDEVVNDALCLNWLAEMAAGWDAWHLPPGSLPSEIVALRARLSILLDLWRGVSHD